MTPFTSLLSDDPFTSLTTHDSTLDAARSAWSLAHLRQRVIQTGPKPPASQAGALGSEGAPIGLPRLRARVDVRAGPV